MIETGTGSEKSHVSLKHIYLTILLPHLRQKKRNCILTYCLLWQAEVTVSYVIIILPGVYRNERRNLFTKCIFFLVRCGLKLVLLGLLFTTEEILQEI